jgi:hypothetical protein
MSQRQTAQMIACDCCRRQRMPGDMWTVRLCAGCHEYCVLPNLGACVMGERNHTGKVTAGLNGRYVQGAQPAA